MAKCFKALAGAALLLACGLASAQLPIGNGGALFSGVNKANPNPSQILDIYIGNAQALLNANKDLLSAVGLSEPAARAGAEAQNLTPQSSRSQIENALKIQADSGQALTQKLAAGEALSAAGKLQFITGVTALSHGLIASAGMSRDLVDIRKTLKGANGAAISVLYLSKALPGSVREVGQTLQAAVAYAKANNLTLPPVANEALALL
jgi:hypothetical protein